MVTVRTLVLGYLPLLLAERGLELLLSARHGRRLRARGAVEAGQGHYPPMVLFHLAFLAALLALAGRGPGPPPGLALLALGLALLAQALRWWAILTLGERWSTRILVLPGAPPVRSGPYRYLRHPNYLAVAVEMLALPLALGSPLLALLFSLSNAALLAVRVRAEEFALGDPFLKAFEKTPRFFPRGGP